jgi:hypothetical protein
MAEEGELVRDYVDERILAIYWDAVGHCGTTDLVVIFETEREVDPVSVRTRESILKAPSAPASFQKRFANPPKASGEPGVTSFWFVALFPEQTVIVAVRAMRLGVGGDA